MPAKASDEVVAEVATKASKPVIDLANEPLIEITRDPATFISGPWLSENSSIDINLLSFQKSYGYSCHRIFNLCLIVPDVLVFASGNFIHFFTISKRTMKIRRCSTGGGIGYITKNPNPAYNFLTVAENGSSPPIIIYRYPDMKVMALCENGTKSCYTFVDYSPDGEMMASQGGHPDFMITLWKWKSGTVILRTRSFQNTVVKVSFSLYTPGQLSTCGTGHIKFWRICETFTGLKLVGEHGRFGKTEICDIVGALAMPLGSTLSGSEWGNILVWEEGLIKFEVCRKNRLRCHQGAISEIYLRDGEVMTVGRDGYVRIWFWETVELADPPDDDLFVEIDPIYEYRIGSAEHLCSLHTMVKRDDVSWWWYAQDGNGGIWMADISPENTPQPSQMLFQCHAGAIVGVGACPFGTYIATFDTVGALHVYNYATDKLLFRERFKSKGRCMMWLPLSVDPSGTVLLFGFEDGVVRLVCIDLSKGAADSTGKESDGGSGRVRLLQVWKPHSAGLTRMSINQRCTILVTAAEDSTLFIHQVFGQEPFVRINPIGFIDIPSPGTALNWKPNMLSTLIVGCMHGEVLEMDVPERPRSYTELSYQLTHIEFKKFVFDSRKSQLRRDIHLAEMEKMKENKRRRKQRSLERLRSENPDIKIDEETFLADSESDEELEPIYIPPVPNRVLWLMYTVDNTIWLSMGQYDCGYVYEIQFGKDMQCTPIVDAEDLEINSFLYFDDYLLFGMQDGSLRINRVQSNLRNLSDYWSLTMHDNSNGVINDICLSYDHQYVFTVGDDGNIFSYKWNFKFARPSLLPHTAVAFPDESVPDIDDPAALSLEQQKQKNNRDKRAMIANERKAKVLSIIDTHKKEFAALMVRNLAMIPSQRIDRSDIVLDKRITSSLKATLNDQAKLVKRKLAFNLEKNRLLLKKVQDYFIDPIEDLVTEVFGLRLPISVKTFRLNILGSEFTAMVELVKEMIQIEADSKRVIQVTKDSGPEEKKQEIKRLESFLEVLTASTIEFRLGLQPSRLLKKYRARKEAERLSQEQWDHINSLMPDVTRNDPKDDEALRMAAATIGDYKLRTDPAYVSTEDESSSASKKYQRLLEVREELGSIRSNYNKDVFMLRRMKVQLIEYINKERAYLQIVQKEIAENRREHLAEFCPSPESLEFPEYAIELERCEKTRSPVLKPRDPFSFFTYNMAQISIFIANPDRYKAMLKESERSTNLMIDLIQIRLEERIFDQRQLMTDVAMRIKRFDKEIYNLRQRRLEIEVAGKFLDLFLLTLNQELWVLRDFKQLEDQMVGNVNEKIMAQNDINAELTSLKLAIEQHRKNIDGSEADCKMLTQQFTVAATGNKFWDFLRKIYKKKYRVPRVVDPDDYDVSSESSDESSTDEEDDAGSRDSADIGPVNIDENVCPAGCERILYDLTFELRSRRHVIEQIIKDELATIEVCKASIAKLNKQLKIVESELKIRTDDLATFMTVKQKTLNEIDTLVVIKMSQMQHFVDAEQFVNIDDTILFNNDCINSLYARVAEIEMETIKARQQHRINVMHLSRMKTDCKYMNKMLAELAEQYDIEMVKKFGMIVNLDELEEGILRRMVYNIRANTDCIQKEYSAKAKELRAEHAAAQERLKCLVEQEIEKLNVLTVLQEEQNWLHTLAQNRERSAVSSKTAMDDVVCEEDVTKLSAIAAHQRNEIALLTNEINMLRMKAKNVDDITQPPLADEDDDDVRGSVPLEPYRRKPDSTRSDQTDFTFTSQPSGRSEARANAIQQAVDQFLDKHRDTVDTQELTDIGQRICAYFVSIADRFAALPEAGDDVSNDGRFAEVVGNFRQMIPANLWPRFPVTDVAQLFRQLVAGFQLDAQPEGRRIQPVDLMRGIMEDTLDTLSTFQPTLTTQVLITESLKNAIVGMSVEDMQRPEVVSRMVRMMSGAIDKPLRTEFIDEQIVFESVMEHGQENYVDDLTSVGLKDLIRAIVEGLFSMDKTE